MVRQNGSFSHEKMFCQPIHEAAMSNPPMPLNRLPCLSMVMFFNGLWMFRRSVAAMVRFAGEKGSCDLFPTRMLPVPAGIGLLPGKFGFCGYGRDTSAVRTKT